MLCSVSQKKKRKNKKGIRKKSFYGNKFMIQGGKRADIL